jgi:hypothetical protein
MALFLHRSGIMAGTQAPTIITTNTGNEAVADTTYSCPLPASLVSGNLIIVIGALWVSASASQFNTPSGWTQLFQSSGTSTLRSLACFYRVSDGLEGATLAMTTTVNAFKSSVAYQLSGHVGAPEAGTVATGSTSVPDPPSLSPSWGSRPTLWLAAMAHTVATAVQTAPSGYGSIIQDAAVDSGADRPRTAVARLARTAASENPGAFGTSATAWAANTIAVQGP